MICFFFIIRPRQLLLSRNDSTVFLLAMPEIILKKQKQKVDFCFSIKLRRFRTRFDLESCTGTTFCTWNQGGKYKASTASISVPVQHLSDFPDTQVGFRMPGRFAGLYFDLTQY